MESRQGTGRRRERHSPSVLCCVDLSPCCEIVATHTPPAPQKGALFSSFNVACHLPELPLTATNKGK